MQLQQSFKNITCHIVRDDRNKILAGLYNDLQDNVISMSDYMIKDPLMVDLRLKKKTAFYLQHHSVRSGLMQKTGPR